MPIGHIAWGMGPYGLRFWCVFWIYGHHFGTFGHECGTPGHMKGPCIELYQFPMRFWILQGSCFAPLGATVSFPGIRNDGIAYFVGKLNPG